MNVPAKIDRVIDAFEHQASECRAFGSPFSAELLAAGASALRRGGHTRDLLADWPGNPFTDALPTRVLGALNAAVLKMQDVDLVRAYPGPGRVGDGAAAWAAGERFIHANTEWINQWLASPPQTNEVARSAALLSGLLTIAGQHTQPIDLLELGASAGLNLNLDRFRYELGTWNWGGDSEVKIAAQWFGPPPSFIGSLHIVGRSGCDQSPLDVLSSDDRLRLSAYIWADQHDRAERLQAAMRIAARLPPRIERRDAADWIEEQLADTRHDRLTVIYHSIFYHYLSRPVRERIAAAVQLAGARATSRSPIAWLKFEFEAAIGGPTDSRRCVLEITHWPGPNRRLAAVVDPHGRSVHWLG